MRHGRRPSVAKTTDEVRALMSGQRRTMNEERIPHMLYYVKTDRLFNSLEVEVDDRKLFDSEATQATFAPAHA